MVGVPAAAAAGGTALALRKGKKKESSADPAAIRAYVSKVAAVAQDPDAAPAERAKAAGLLAAVRGRVDAAADRLTTKEMS